MRFSSFLAVTSVVAASAIHAPVTHAAGYFAPAPHQATVFQAYRYEGEFYTSDLREFTVDGRLPNGLRAYVNRLPAPHYKIIIEGVPEESGSFPITLQSVAEGQVWARPMTIVVWNPRFDITPSAIVRGRVGTIYEQPLGSSEADAPRNWIVSSGMPPAGIELTRDGVLRGTPTTAGLSMFTVSAEDATGRSGSRTYQLEVEPAIPLFRLQITTRTAPVSGRVGEAYPAQIFRSSRTGSAIRWDAGSGALPPGLALDPMSGVLSGTPTTAGTFSFRLKVLDAVTGDSDVFETSITIRPRAIAPITTPSEIIPPAPLTPPTRTPVTPPRETPTTPPPTTPTPTTPPREATPVPSPVTPGASDQPIPTTPGTPAPSATMPSASDMDELRAKQEAIARQLGLESTNPSTPNPSPAPTTMLVVPAAAHTSFKTYQNRWKTFQTNMTKWTTSLAKAEEKDPFKTLSIKAPMITEEWTVFLKTQNPALNAVNGNVADTQAMFKKWDENLRVESQTLLTLSRNRRITTAKDRALALRLRQRIPTLRAQLTATKQSFNLFAKKANLR